MAREEEEAKKRKCRNILRRTEQAADETGGEQNRWRTEQVAGGTGGGPSIGLQIQEKIADFSLFSIVLSK